MPFYPGKLEDFPKKIMDLLRNDGKMIPVSLRRHLAQALILLVNRKIITIEETLELFVDLQIVGDKTLRILSFSHVVHSIRRMNQKHKDEAKNRKLQNILFSILQQEDEGRAKRALVVLCDFHRRKVWFDDRTANAICIACFHSSSRIMISALSFILRYEQIEEEDDDEGSSSEDDTTIHKPLIALNKQDIYKAHHKGTLSSKKKKKAKLQRVIRSLKKQNRLSNENSNSNSYSPLTHLKDAQGFAEKLFSCLQKCNEKFEVKMMILKVISRSIGLHRLVVINFYPFLQKYVQPHQRDVTSLLAAAAQACHDMVPPDAVEPLFKQIVNQFVHDHSRTESIAVGLNVVREICLRMPLLMTEDLLQDLVLYKKSHEKAVSTAARSLVTLFREICPSLLVKKDRGRLSNPKAKPKAFGEVTVVSHVPGVELLENSDGSTSGSDDMDHDNDDMLPPSSRENSLERPDKHSSAEADEGTVAEEDDNEEEDEGIDDDDNNENMNDDSNEEDMHDDSGNDDDLDSGNDDDLDSDNDDDLDSDNDNVSINVENDDSSSDNVDDNSDDVGEEEDEKSKVRKRKFLDFDGSLNASNASLRALKRLTRPKPASNDDMDGILSNEDFQKIKELRAKKNLKEALSNQGFLRKCSDSNAASFKVPSSEQLSTKRVDPAKLEVNIKRKLSKEERLALVKAGREDRGKYVARRAVKQKKTGGLSNRQKEHKKAMPFAAKKAKVVRSRQEKKKKLNRAGKQFRGKKAWK